MFWWFHVVLVVLCIAFYVKKYIFKKKLRWVHSISGYPVIGSAFELWDRTSKFLTDV